MHCTLFYEGKLRANASTADQQALRRCFLPQAGKARVIVLTDDGSVDAEWRLAAYEQFLHEDHPEDAIYGRTGL